MSSDREEAERRYTKVFLALNRRWVDMTNFRRLAELGKPYVTGQVAREANELARTILTDPQFDAYFLDRGKAVEFFGGPKGLADSLTTQQLSDFQRAVDAASLVFVHSAVDAAASDFCRIAVLAAPTDWEHLLIRQKADLAKIKASSYDTILQEVGGVPGIS